MPFFDWFNVSFSRCAGLVCDLYLAEEERADCFALIAFLPLFVCLSLTGLMSLSQSALG